MIEIKKGTSISEAFLSFKFSRSSGPGGQNVNKVNSRVTLFFDVVNCGSLTGPQKKRVLANLSSRANKKGQIRVVSQKYRTQKANRKAATNRLIDLLAEALSSRKVRRKTTVPQRAIESRLAGKKRRGKVKKLRTQRDFSED